MGLKQIISSLILVGFLAAAGYGIYKSGALSPEQAVNVPTPTAVAKIGDVEQQVLATGQVAPISETEIRSEVSGQVTALQVSPGQRVTKDQQLLQLDRRELESEANEDNFQIIADQLKVKQAQSELDRDQKLIDKGFIPQKEFDDAGIALSLAQNDLEVQKAKLETLHQQIVKTDIRAPHEGIVLKLDVREGEVIVGTNSTSSGTVLMRIADLSKLKVDTRLNEVDVVRVHVNDHVKLTFDAVPGLTMNGTVTYISPSADTGDESTGSGMMGKSSSSETRRPRVRDHRRARYDRSSDSTRHHRPRGDRDGPRRQGGDGPTDGGVQRRRRQNRGVCKNGDGLRQARCRNGFER